MVTHSHTRRTYFCALAVTALLAFSAGALPQPNAVRRPGHILTVLWSFGRRVGRHPTPGKRPYARLSSDGAVLYGTTSSGGPDNDGTVFELTPSVKGYMRRYIWSFGGQTHQDGSTPVADLLLNGGNIYGTTAEGGAFGYGTVFKLTPSGKGYLESVLWSFGKGHDGKMPDAGLVMDASGALYGTTFNGGAYHQVGVCATSGPTGCGTVFKLTPSGTGYHESLVWSFGNNEDGFNPEADLLVDSSGAIYGTTVNGGAYGYGTVFRLTQSGSKYTEQILWSLGSGQDAKNPQGGLLPGAGGTLFGTTVRGGTGMTAGCTGCGSVFELMPKGSLYTERVLFSFCTAIDRRRMAPNLGCADGALPYGTLISDPSGALYGTTSYGGTGGYGTVFKLTPAGSGYTESVLWSFNYFTDGNSPQAGLTAQGSAFYGTTQLAGKYGYGTVFRVIP